MQTINSNTATIVFNSKGLETLSETLISKNYASLFVLVDDQTEQFCLPLLMESIPFLAAAQILRMESGEENKHIQTCIQLWEDLSTQGADRKSALVNLGGGVVTDLGGFVACTFKRGIDFYNIPTTLLAMVDASVGGKTGIDLGALKNQIGIIREPEMVVVDPRWLTTLPAVEIRSGFAEMLKHGLIADREYWEQLIQLDELQSASLTPFIHHSVVLKNEVVLQDPTEKGLRKILNYGHTLGHAIESYFLTQPDKTRLLHGEAIAIGMILEAYLSTVLTGLDVDAARAIREQFQRFYGVISFSTADITAILELLQHDKKNSHGKVNFVLLKSIGNPAIDIAVPNELFKKAFDFYLAP